ncbi:MAG: hypothetical protein K6G22_00630, partial [Lachnospiraceae bacterium]|nr:hypothetical protein [Lachnospiraceae bacterium]
MQNTELDKRWVQLFGRIYDGGKKDARWNQELKERLVKSFVDEGRMPLPLYHGTGEFALSLPDAEREELIAGCHAVIDFYSDYALRNKHVIYRKAEKGQIRMDREELKPLFAALYRIIRKKAAGACDHIYLTTSYRKARAYAEAFGICGEVFYVADGIERIVSEMNPEDATP